MTRLVRPPYGAYTTSHVLRIAGDSTCDRIGAWYRRELPRRGWRWIAGYPGDASYVRGHALVHVTCSGEGPRAALILSADHDER
jgi:hypothetical protein